MAGLMVGPPRRQTGPRPATLTQGAGLGLRHSGATAPQPHARLFVATPFPLDSPSTHSVDHELSYLTAACRRPFRR